MADKPPVVYILNGEDEFAMSSFLTGLQAKMGDPTIAERIPRLDG
jgi:hypothetical protein